jgi:hypothetical protein
MHFFEFILIDMGIYLRRRYVRVPEHFLDAAQFGSAFQQMRGKRVSQCVRGYMFFYACLLGVFLDYLPDTLPGQAFA